VGEVIELVDVEVVAAGGFVPQPIKTDTLTIRITTAIRNLFIVDLLTS
jgi:hypothetical protein